MPMNDPEEAQRLIRLKRYESPGEGYYASFLDEFKERQRSEMLRLSARDLLFERVAMWLEESGGAKRFVPVGAMAAAAIGAGLYFATASPDRPAPETYVAAPVADLGGAGIAPLAEAAEDEIHLQLPRQPVHAAGFVGQPSPGGSLVPASVRGGLREL